MAPSGGHVREELGRILGSACFRKGPRLARLLRYLVESSLNGSSAQLKEYTLGVEVFERKDFDPRVDTEVRSTARHLRFKLDEYYKTEGCNDSVIIELPKGSYVPMFRWREAPPARPRAVHHWWRVSAVILAVLGLAIAGTEFLPRKTAPVDSLAVLPFENRTGDSGAQYLADGLTGEVTAAFVRMPGLRVIAPSSAAAALQRSGDLRAIARELNVAAVLTGSVERGGSGIRVRARLEEGGRNRVLWSGAFESGARDIGSVEAPVVREASRALGLNLPAALQSSDTADPDAHDLYIQGRYQWSRRDGESLRKSVSLFERAIEKDSQYALAYTGLADAYGVMADNDKMPAAEALPRAEAAAVRALALAPESAEAHASLGLIKSSEWDWAGAERELRLALKLNPGYDATYQRLASSATIHRRFDEAEALLRRAQVLDPMNWMLTYNRGENAYYAGRYDDAIALANQIREVAAGPACNLLERVYFHRGMMDEAKAAADCEFRGRGGFEGDLIRATEAGATERFLSLAEHPPAGIDAFYLAGTAARLRLKELSLDCLERAYALRTPDLASIGIEPDLEVLHGEPRYLRLREKLGL
jgi:serine/threonine-protein kinase